MARSASRTSARTTAWRSGLPGTFLSSTSDDPRLQGLVSLVARREYLRTVRRRGYIFGTLLLPFGIAALMALSTIFSVDSFDGDGGPATANIVIVNTSDVVIDDIVSGPVRLTTVTPEQAADIVREKGLAKTATIQRQMKVGFQQSEAILAKLELAGVVTPLKDGIRTVIPVD